jgi:hypothetical protein
MITSWNIKYQIAMLILLFFFHSSNLGLAILKLFFLTSGIIRIIQTQTVVRDWETEADENPNRMSSFTRTQDVQVQS